MAVMAKLIEAAERGRIPDALLRQAIRQVARGRLRRERRAMTPRHAWLDSMRQSPIALSTGDANRQHYEVPAAFFRLVLGRHLKYSGSEWDDFARDVSASRGPVEGGVDGGATVDNLDAAEATALARVVQRAQLVDGQRVLELGCGWGSLSLWMAERLPASRIVAVSNSQGQREFIVQQAKSRGLRNLEVLTADMNAFAPQGRCDRVVSIEMFEHMRNWERLLRRIGTWLQPDGKLFVHVFAHRRYSYPYAEATPAQPTAQGWMQRHFFSGGMMPAHGLLEELPSPFESEQDWWIDGRHYARSARAWLANLDANRAAAAQVLNGVDHADSAILLQRWRMFFMSCEEMFAARGGREWGVSQRRLRLRQPSIGSVQGLVEGDAAFVSPGDGTNTPNAQGDGMTPPGDGTASPEEAVSTAQGAAEVR